MAAAPISLQRAEVAALAKTGKVRDAAFVAGDFGSRHGFILNIEFAQGRNKRHAVLAKQDGDPRLFVTPQTCTKNAQKLGLLQYRFDTRMWNPQHYDSYDAQVRSHRKKRERSKAESKES